jgi:transposase-like protein
MLKKYLPYAFIALAFFLGQLSTPRADDQLRAKFENEREIQNRIIRQKNMQIISLQGERRMIKERAIQDSIHFADLLEAKDKRIKALTIKINAVDYHRFNSNQLDSVRALLLAR